MAKLSADKTNKGRTEEFYWTNKNKEEGKENVFNLIKLRVKYNHFKWMGYNSYIVAINISLNST